ncbi:hypothetical protein NL676_023153 [Syzygium grande]|nr:hypothetical protein NL676_023153 [Syzygium grande]
MVSHVKRFPSFYQASGAIVTDLYTYRRFWAPLTGVLSPPLSLSLSLSSCCSGRGYVQVYAIKRFCLFCVVKLGIAWPIHCKEFLRFRFVL